jgi:hypothetical protein
MLEAVNGVPTAAKCEVVAAAKGESVVEVQEELKRSLYSVTASNLI